MNTEHRMISCPSYINCKAPICPLETVYPSRSRFRLKGEGECVAGQFTRYKLGEGLKYRGLFKQEYVGYESTVGFEGLNDRVRGKFNKIAKLVDKKGEL